MMTKAQKKYITAVLRQLVDDAGYEYYESGGKDKLTDVSDYLRDIEDILK
jgi:hypothetical protein